MQACNVENINDSDNGISGNGTIVKSAENFLLNTDSGFQYLTENLSNEFKIDKIRVEFRGNVHKNPDQTGIDKIEFTYIKKLN